MNEPLSTTDLANLNTMQNEGGAYLPRIEREILNLIFYGGERELRKISSRITENDFTTRHYAEIFRCCFTLHEDGEQLNGANILARLKRDAPAALHIFADEIAASRPDFPLSADITELAAQLHTETLRRRLLTAYQEGHRRLLDGGDVQEELALVRTEAQRLLAESAHRAEFISVHDAAGAAIERQQREDAGEIVRIPTGFASLDTIIGGLENGSLYVLAAQTNVGKSLFAGQIAMHAARQHLPVGIASLEMRARDLGKRYFKAAGAEKLIEMQTARNEFAGLPLWICDGSLDAKRLDAVLWRLVDERKARLVVLDYLQLVDCSERNKARWETIGELVKHLKRFAHDADIPVLVVCALSTKPMATRMNRAPLLADLRDTSDISYHADCVLFLWQPDASDAAYIECVVAKARNTGRGEIGLLLNKETLTFNETARRQPSSDWGAVGVDIYGGTGAAF